MLPVLCFVGWILPQVGWRAHGGESDIYTQWEKAWLSLNGKLKGVKLIVPVGDEPPPQDSGQEPEARLASLAAAIGGKVVREGDIIMIRRPREYAPLYEMNDLTRAGACYELLRQLPEEQLQALLDGQAVPENLWSQPVARAVRQLFTYSAFEAPKVDVKIGSRAELLLWLEKVYGRSPTVEEVLQIEAAVNKEKKRLEALQKIERLVALSLEVDCLIKVAPPGQERYCPNISVFNLPARTILGWQMNKDGFLEPAPISEKEIYDMFDKTLEQLMGEVSK